MNKLIFEFSPVGKIRRIIPAAGGEWFSNVVLKVRTVAGCECVLFSINWDSRVLIEWLSANADEIINEPFIFLSDRSLARTIADKIEEDLSESDEDLLYEYRVKHDLRFALRGVDIPSIILGVGVRGYEISVCGMGFEMVFAVDLGALLHGLAALEKKMGEDVQSGYFEGERLALSS